MLTTNRHVQVSLAPSRVAGSGEGAGERGCLSSIHLCANTALVIIACLTLLSSASFARAADETNAPAKPKTTQPEIPALKQPVKSVLEHYLKMQAALADDSMTGVASNAAAIAKAVKDDKSKMLSSEVAEQAEAIAKAKELPDAREAFKSLSESLIKYLADHQVDTSTYREYYCPMQEASWLQTEKETANPYLGSSMPGCGLPKRVF